MKVVQGGRRVNPVLDSPARSIPDSEAWRAWLPEETSHDAPASGMPRTTVALTGPAEPQPHVPATPGGLPARPMPGTAELWVVGASGGSGESTLAELVPTWEATDHAWPQVSQSAPATCVLTARTSVRGLLAAQAALTQWAGSRTDSSVQLLGLVLVADAPGRLPPPLRDLAKLVRGGAPRTWSVPWVEAWRLGVPVVESTPRVVGRLVSQVSSLIGPATAGVQPHHAREHTS